MLFGNRRVSLAGPRAVRLDCSNLQDIWVYSICG